MLDNYSFPKERIKELLPVGYSYKTTPERYKQVMNIRYGIQEGFGGFTMYGTLLCPRKVIFHDPATIVYWTDGSKTVVKCQEGDTYDKHTGLAYCFAKKALGNNGHANTILNKLVKEYGNEEN